MEQWHRKPGSVAHTTSASPAGAPCDYAAETRLATDERNAGPRTLADVLTDSGRLRIVQRPPGSASRSTYPECVGRGHLGDRAAEHAGASSGASILVAENERGNRQLIEHILSMAGYHPIGVSNGLEALCLITDAQVDLVLLDLSMPVVDGFRVAHLIRTRAEYARLPVVAVSGYAHADAREQAFAAGCTAFLTKPFRPRDLLVIVARLLAVPERR